MVRVIFPLLKKKKKKKKKIVIFDFVYTKSIICKYRPVSTKLGRNIYVQQNLIMGPIGPEQLELFALELGKIAAVDFVYSLASTNINQSAPNLVKMNMSIDLR